MEEDDSRASMFEVIRYSAHHKYEGVLVENVPEILMWSMYPMWVRAMQALGYSYNYLLVNSAHTNHHGPATPQNRLRYYGMFWLGDKDIHWPQFHGPSPRAWDYLDNNPGPLLEDRAVPLASTTLRRIENTLARHRLDPRVFVKYYGSAEVGARITEPFPTITTRDHLAIATRMSDGIHYRLLSLGEKARAGGFGDSYIWPESVADATKLIGNAVSPSAARDIAWPMIQSMEHTLR
jgi:DNA (cytosine-5)-methyltransferase 1